MRAIRVKKLCLKLGGLDRSTLWRWQKGGDFPKPYRLGPNVRAWDEDEVDAWLEGRRVAREHAGKVA